MKNVDNTQINTVEWFFGYGGNHLGLKRVIPNMRLLAVCEREGYACANMVAKMEAGLLDSAPIWTDAKTFPSRQFHGLVDLFVASYPCQGFSCAGKREGSRDPRFLWPWVFRFVVDARPSVVFFENVEGHVSLGLSSCVSDLEEAGYTVAPGIFSAAECGATHRRKRVFILGYDTRQRGGPRWAKWSRWFGERASEFSSHVADAECSERWPPASDSFLSNREEIGRHEGSSGVGECGQNVADAAGVGEREQDDAECAESREDAREDAGRRSDELGDAQSDGCEGRVRENRQSNGSAIEQGGLDAAGTGALFWPSAPARPGEPQHAWEPPRVIKTVGGLGGGSDGRAANVDRLRLLGNGVYPACAAKAFLVLAEKLKA